MQSQPQNPEFRNSPENFYPWNQPMAPRGCKTRTQLIWFSLSHLPSHIAQSVTSLATDANLTAHPGVANSILARSHTFVDIDHEIISTVILLPSAESFMKGCCQLQAKVCTRITG